MLKTNDFLKNKVKAQLMFEIVSCRQWKAASVHTHTWTSVGGAAEGQGQLSTDTLNIVHVLYQRLTSVLCGLLR